MAFVDDSAAASNLSAPTGGMGACWCARIKEGSLGFLSHQDKDVLDACPHLLWLEGRVPEGSAGKLHWVPHVWRLLD
jgi:hypothetical protein